MARGGAELDPLAGLAAGICAGVAGALLLLQIEHSWLAWRNVFEGLIELVILAQSLGIVLFVLPEAIRGRRCLAPLPIAQTLAWLRAPDRATLDTPLYLGLVQLLSVFTALVISLGLSFDARYRDFPLAAFSLAAVSLALLALNRGDHKKQVEDRREEALLAALFIATGCVIAFNEGTQNIQAMTWTALDFVFALPWLGILRASLRTTLFRRAATEEA
jgi:glucan 1,3-beta-glucosidase